MSSAIIVKEPGRSIVLRSGDSELTIRSGATGPAGTPGTNGGITQDVVRVAGDTTLDATHHNVFCDTDGGAIAITLPAGVTKKAYRIVNTGSSGNNVTISPDGAELLLGQNVSFALLDGDTLATVYEATEGWW